MKMMGDGLGAGASPPTSLLAALRPYLHTCELFAPKKDEFLDLHALKHLDVAWVSGVVGGGKGYVVEEKWTRFPGKFFGRCPGATSVSNLDSTYHTPTTQDQTHL